MARQLFAGTLIRDADPERIVLMGDSAGGNLTAAVSLLARERGDFRPRTQILLYPLVYNDHSETTLFDSVRDTYRLIAHFLDGDPLPKPGDRPWLTLLGTD